MDILVIKDQYNQICLEQTLYKHLTNNNVSGEGFTFIDKIKNIL